METKTETIQILTITILLTFGLTSASAQKRVGSKKLREVKIYLVKATEEYDPKNQANLFPVKRKVDTASPLHGALKALMRGETKQEEKRNLYAATFGIQFVSVTLENGTALASFTIEG